MINPCSERKVVRLSNLPSCRVMRRRHTPRNNSVTPEGSIEFELDA
jgi:hypothetical protein